MTSDELDAVTAPLVGLFPLHRRGEMLGSEDDILIPRCRHKQRKASGKLLKQKIGL